MHALAGNGYVGVTWKTTSGGESYIVKRSESEQGPYSAIATGVRGNYYKDATVINGKVYYYKVSAVNENGEGWDSWRAKADLAVPVSAKADDVWRDDRIGDTSGTAMINGTTIEIEGAQGTGLGQGTITTYLNGISAIHCIM